MRKLLVFILAILGSAVNAQEPVTKAGAAGEPATTPPPSPGPAAGADQAEVVTPADPVAAEPAGAGGTAGETRQLEAVIVRERSDSLLEVADSAAQGTVGSVQLSRRPLLRPGEVAETVPGVIITQHSGTGKANQFFLRGFNLDHGTDLAFHLEGVPLNLPSHGHGQGYTDLNFLIPELIQTVDFRKGPYYAQAGDFSSTGEVRIAYLDRIDQSLAKIEGGSFAYLRGVVASSVAVGQGTILYAGEVAHDDGPWSHPDNATKLNGVIKYVQGTVDRGFSVTAIGYHNKWDATDQIARRAVDTGLIRRFGSLDESDGGDSQRYGAIGEFHLGDADSRLEVVAYSYYYDLNLFSNFTYFLSDPVNGDQFEQMDQRVVVGGSVKQDWFGKFWWGRDVTNTLGAQVRSDFIENGLFPTLRRQRLGRVREDDIIETSFGPFFEHKTQWHEKVRTFVGVRGDLFDFDVDSDQSVNSGEELDFIASPKGGLVLGPWAATEIYANAGLGFHSNDARGVTTTVDPSTGTPVDEADPLVRTRGAEVGVRTLIVPGLQSTVSLWGLDSDSELVFVGDAGTTEASRPSRRYGVEWANYYSVTPWLDIDADFAFSHARFRNDDPAGDEIPGSIESVIAAGLTFHDLGGFFGGLRLRYFGPRPLIEDGSVESSETLLLNARVGYEFKPGWSVAVDIFNLLDREDNDIEYFYTSRLQGEPAAGVDDRHFHPAYPFSVHVSLQAVF
jgi:hypothetical protein